ncbi:hypothetical protein K8R43_03160 [archaeon]|nr:hypothetical protein [archaeon]
MPKKREPVLAGKLLGRGLKSKSEKKVLEAIKRIDSCVPKLKPKQLDGIHKKISSNLSHSNPSIKIETIHLVNKLAENKKLEEHHIKTMVDSLTINISNKEYLPKYMSAQLLYSLSKQNTLKKQHLNQKLIDKLHSLTRTSTPTTERLALVNISTKLIQLWSKKEYLKQGEFVQGKSEWIIKK